MLLVDEDEHRAYSDVLLKYFMSEGVAAGNELVVASGRVRPFSCIAYPFFLPIPVLIIYSILHPSNSLSYSHALPADMDPLQLTRGMYQAVTTADSTAPSSSAASSLKEKEQMEISWRSVLLSPLALSNIDGGIAWRAPQKKDL